MLGALRAQPVAPWSVESTRDGVRHVRPVSTETELRSSAVLSPRGDHHAANTLVPDAASRTEAAHAGAGTTVRGPIGAGESGTSSPVAWRATDEPAACTERDDSHTTGESPLHASAVATMSITGRLAWRHGIHENSRED